MHRDGGEGERGGCGPLLLPPRERVSRAGEPGGERLSLFDRLNDRAREPLRAGEIPGGFGGSQEEEGGEGEVEEGAHLAGVPQQTQRGEARS